jgi:DNA-binding MarR family transcriptional regulator
MVCWGHDAAATQAAKQPRSFEHRYAPCRPLGTYSSRMPRGSATGSRAASAGDAAPVVPRPLAATDVARLRVAVARLSRWLRRHDLAGLTPTQLSALATVDRLGPLRLGDLAAVEGIAPSTLTRLVTVLEERGYVERCPVPGDARASTLVIAPAGHEVLERIREQSTILLAGRLETLTDEQRAALAAALPALERLAETDPGDPRSR